MGHERDFLTVGSMGHASAIALGVAMKKPKRMVSYMHNPLQLTVQSQNIVLLFTWYILLQGKRSHCN